LDYSFQDEWLRAHSQIVAPHVSSLSQGPGFKSFDFEQREAHIIEGAEYAGQRSLIDELPGEHSHRRFIRSVPHSDVHAVHAIGPTFVQESLNSDPINGRCIEGEAFWRRHGRLRFSIEW
jgi:hypothetical protein